MPLTIWSAVLGNFPKQYLRAPGTGRIYESMTSLSTDCPFLSQISIYFFVSFKSQLSFMDICQKHSNSNHHRAIIKVTRQITLFRASRWDGAERSIPCTWYDIKECNFHQQAARQLSRKSIDFLSAYGLPLLSSGNYFDNTAWPQTEVSIELISDLI